MTARPLTPVFRWLARRRARPAPPGVICYAAPAPGNHAGEAVCLAVATCLLTASAVVPATAGVASAWLRWPLVTVLLFLVPHGVMGLVALGSGWIAGKHRHRGVVQDWCCLAVMTGYAAWGVMGTGWESWICQGWLGFVALNGAGVRKRLIGKARLKLLNLA